MLDGVEAPANYSVAVHDDHRGVRSLDGLWWQYTKLHQSRAPVRVVRALFGYLADHVDPPEGSVRVAAVALVGPGGAVVADRSLANHRLRLLPFVRKLGLQVVDSRWAHIDDGGALVVQPPPFQIDDAAIERLVAAEPRRKTGPELAVAPGRYPVRAWLIRPTVWAAGAPTAPVPSKAAALIGAVNQAAAVPAGAGQRALDALARSIAGADLESFRPSDFIALEALLSEITA